MVGINIGGIIWDATNAYDGVAVEIYFQGCKLNCKNCHNPQFQSFDGGKEISINKLLDLLKERKKWFDIVSYLGGEPLLQKDLQELTTRIKHEFPDKPLILYTGADLKDIPQWCFELFDAIKYGRYIQELHCDNPLFGSSNQGYIVKGKDY